MDTADARTRIGPGWRLFQFVGVVAALSYLFGWFYAGPNRYLDGLGGGVQSTWGSVVGLLSPIVAIVMIVLALAPERMSFLTERRPGARLALAAILVLAAAWMVNAIFFSPMYDKFLTTPGDPAKVLPISGGVFLHMVLQHWFQSIAVIVLALSPERYASLLRSPVPAGLQCAVVRCA